MRYTVNLDNAFWRVLEGEAVIISAETSYYYSLNKTGTYIWSLLIDGAPSLEEIVARVAEKYARREVEVAEDVGQMLKSLSAEKLIVTR